MGGRGATIGGRGKSELLPKKNTQKSEKIDTSNWSFNVVEMTDFEKYFAKEKTEHAFIITPEGRIRAGYKGNKNTVNLNSADIRKGDTLTHNHPSSYGGTFSPNDVYALTNNNLSEIRAVAREGTYSLKATTNADPNSFSKALARNLSAIRRKGNKNAGKVDKAKYKTEKGYQRATRRARVDTLSSWYKKNANKYGYIYTAPKGS